VITSNRAARDAKIAELAEEYAMEGYQVIRDPEASLLPFDSFGYRPSLLARKRDHTVIAEVRTVGRPGTFDRFVDVVGQVKKHGGMSFPLVFVEDVEAAVLPEEGELLPTWDQLQDQVVRNERLLRGKDAEGAFLGLWIALEGIFRREARDAALSVERLPTAALIEHLHAHGVLAREPYETLRALLPVRERAVHGFQADDLAEAASRLLRLVRALLGAWAPGRKAA
jgi:hypothetical protein